MKRFLKINIVVIIILLVFGAIFLYGDYQVIQNNQDIVELTNNLQEQCKTKVITDEEEKKFKKNLDDLIKKSNEIIEENKDNK